MARKVVATGRKCFYPFEKMKVGDSFLIPESENKTGSMLGNSYSQWTRKRGLKWGFTCRKIDKKGLRVWRIR